MDQFIVVGSASARVVCDSIYHDSRLVSVEIEFPRPFLAEFNTHRVFSRNSASSRAIPVWKRIKQVLDRPYVPSSFGANKSGMQADTELSEEDKIRTRQNWIVGRDIAVIQAYHLIGGERSILKDTAKLSDRTKEEIAALIASVEELVRCYGMKDHFSTLDQGLHKQHANRVLETYAFHTVIVTATHWRNFFGLRPSANAQPEAQDFGIAIGRAMMASSPTPLSKGQWHLPYIRPEDREEERDQIILARAASGKCARTSYLTHDGIRALKMDVEMSDGLQANGHMSPFEHVARPFEVGDPEGSNGNFAEGWTQFRKILPHEGDFTKLVSREELLIGCRGDAELIEFILSLEK
jgi:thymidylate synthase ThyX